MEQNLPTDFKIKVNQIKGTTHQIIITIKGKTTLAKINNLLEAFTIPPTEAVMDNTENYDESATNTTIIHEFEWEDYANKKRTK